MVDAEELSGPEALATAERILAEGGVQRLGEAADLAWRAHDAGVPGAGVVFATCADRLSLLSGRPQRFGTVTMQHQDDVVLAPMDPSVPDDLRAQLGVPPISVLRARIEELNRTRARERAAEDGRLDGHPFVRVWADPSAEELQARREAEGQPVWADGDILTFVCNRPLDGAVVGPVFDLPMWRVEDLLVLQVRVLRLSEAVFTYGFWPLDAAGGRAYTSYPDPDGRWRGPAAPPAPVTHDQLDGSLVETVVESRALGEARRVSVYRPPGFSHGEDLPVVFGTDGQFFAPFARRIDAGIAAGSVPRVVVVAAHAATFDPRIGNRRGMEYLLGFDPRRFEAHERFFISELPAWARDELGLHPERDRTAVFGTSDGGAHALIAATFHPDRFGHVLAGSSGVPPIGSESWKDGEAPRIQLCAGLLEPGFYASTYAWHRHLADTGVDHHWTERVSGHDMIQWVEWLPEALARAFS